SIERQQSMMNIHCLFTELSVASVGQEKFRESAAPATREPALRKVRTWKFSAQRFTKWPRSSDVAKNSAERAKRFGNSQSTQLESEASRASRGAASPRKRRISVTVQRA